MAVTLIAKIKAKQGSEKDLEAAFRDMIKKVRAAAPGSKTCSMDDRRWRCSPSSIASRAQLRASRRCDRRRCSQFVCPRRMGAAPARPSCGAANGAGRFENLRNETYRRDDTLACGYAGPRWRLRRSRRANHTHE